MPFFLMPADLIRPAGRIHTMMRNASVLLPRRAGSEATSLYSVAMLLPYQKSAGFLSTMIETATNTARRYG